MRKANHSKRRTFPSSTKGLLKIKEIPERLDRFMDSKSQYLTFEPGFADVVWSQDPERNMQVYNDIEEKSLLFPKPVENIDLETLISKMWMLISRHMSKN